MGHETEILLSIIVPVFNTANYLPGCIDSILTSIDEFSDVEIICVNDGSTDDSADILYSYRDRDNFSILEKSNTGVSDSRNMGLSCAKGRYVWFVDSDDQISDNAVREIRSVLLKKKPEVLCIGYQVIDDNGEVSSIYHTTAGLLGTAFVTISSQRLLKAHDIKFTSGLKYGEDLLYTWNVLKYSDPNCVEYLDKPFYLYIRRQGSATMIDTIDSYDDHVQSLFVVIDVFQTDRNNEQFPERIKSIADLRWKQTAFNILSISPGSSKNPQYILRRLKEANAYPISGGTEFLDQYYSGRLRTIKKIQFFICNRPYLYRLYFICRKASINRKRI